MSEWRETTLGALCAEGGGGIQTGPFGSQLHASDYVLDGIPSVMPQNIGDNVIHAEGITRIQESDAVRLAKYRMRKGDIVYSRRGDVEKRALVRDNNEGWLCGTGCLRVRLGEQSEHNPAFVSYLLGTEESRAWIVRHAVGATMPNLNTSILSAVPLEVPEPAEQRAIADVLGALDDKIAANTKLAATADDLVRAGLAGLIATAQETVPVSKLVVNRKELAEPAALHPASKYLGLEHLPRRSMWATFAGTAESVTSTKARFERGDILFGKLRPYFHKVIVAPFAGVCSTDILVLNPLSQELAGYTLASLTSDLVVERATAASAGTRMPRTSWKDLASVEVPWPRLTEAKEFSARVSAVRGSVESLLCENKTLVAIRDALLPELMSGKLRVRDMENVLEKAGV